MTVFRWLNNNIGCIEIQIRLELIGILYMLNNNIGCIEIEKCKKLYEAFTWLNNNIGCIEICSSLFFKIIFLC